jgi:hypothetical protein
MSQTIPSNTILLPLYIYPHPGAWDPLYSAYPDPHFCIHILTNTPSIATYPNLHFIVIINPHNGPGTVPWWPNEDYIREIPRLNTLPNVTTLGYVRATYCKRDLESVLEDIETYAERGRAGEELKVDGTFVDETVNLCSEEAKSFLDAIDRKVEESIGMTGKRLVCCQPEIGNRNMMVKC